MSDINWSLLGAPVDIGAHFQQGVAMGKEMVRKRRTENALRAYMTNPDDPTALHALAVDDPDMAFKLARTRNEQQEGEVKAAALQRRAAVGQQYLADPQAAQNAAIGAGDFELAAQLEKLGPEKGKKVADFFKSAAPAAYRMRQMNDPAERMAFWNATKPILLQQGGDPATLDAFDPMDNTRLDAFITQGQSVNDLIDQGKVTWRGRSEFGEYAVDSMGRPVGKGNPFAGGATPAPAAERDPLAPQAGDLPPPSAGMPTGAPDPGKIRVPAYAKQTSGYRTPEHNRDVGGVPNSYHTKRGPDGQPLGRDYVPTGGQSMAQLYVDLKAANPHLEVIRESDHVHTEPRGGARQAAAPRSSEPPRISSPQQMASLASGTVFIAPDGSRRVKP